METNYELLTEFDQILLDREEELQSPKNMLQTDILVIEVYQNQQNLSC